MSNFNSHIIIVKNFEHELANGLKMIIIILINAHKIHINVHKLFHHLQLSTFPQDLKLSANPMRLIEILKNYKRLTSAAVTVLSRIALVGTNTQ